MSEQYAGPEMNDNGNRQSTAERIAWYQSHIDVSVGQIESRISSWKRMGLVRGVLFLISLGLLIAGVTTAAGTGGLWYGLAGVVFLVFLAVVCWHESLESGLNDERIRLRLNRHCLARLQRDWDRLPVVTNPTDNPDRAALINDLDLFGKASLFQLIGGVQTTMGINRLSGWMLGEASVEEIGERQVAVGELAGCDGFRDELRFLVHRLAASDGGPDRLLEWSSQPRQFDRNRILVQVARVSALAMLTVLLLLISGVLGWPVGGPLALGILTLNFLLTVLFAGRIHSQFNQVSTRVGEIGHYRMVYRHIADQSFVATRLQVLHDRLSGPQGDVLDATRSLARIAWWGNMRRHGLLFIPYLALQFGFLSDFHVIDRLMRWKQLNGERVAGWLDALGQWEVLAALGQYARDHGDWVMPEVVHQTDGHVLVSASGIGHPLLPPADCVRNDVQVGPAGSVLLVTGSNMSGKSTLLRSIGDNAILAQLGGPVCARQMSLSPVRIETSMRIQDSLADGVSFFMAELKRLKQIVDIARQYEQRNDCTVLYLLDEILQGTNSRERHIAVTRVVSHLVRHHAIGAVSTHDLELGTTDELAAACRPVHFRESFRQQAGRKQMTFDYQVRTGIATTTNALELLKLVGLDEEVGQP